VDQEVEKLVIGRIVTFSHSEDDVVSGNRARPDGNATVNCPALPESTDGLCDLIGDWKWEVPSELW
jgi:hypothetical protein